MSILVALGSALIALLGAYAVALYATTFAFVLAQWRARRRKPRTAPPPDTAVTVLVPARNEGAMALRVIQSLLEQDTPAPVAVHLLLQDADDTSWPTLQAAFPGARRAPGADSVVLLDDDAGFAGPRRVTVDFTGFEAKADKINWRMPRVTTPLTAILDCDHQAHAGWLSSAAARLRETGARVVQGRRHGLAADGLFALWDSLHQHVGCELFNAAFDGTGLSVFLTGTTFVAETALLQRHPLRPCLTEDTDLSYTLFMAGERVVADTRGASDEEVSPNLYSFLARRRRWAAGHTEAFLRHLPLLRRAGLRWRDRLQFVLHGLHYLVAAATFALHLVIGVLVARDLPEGAVLLALTVATAAAVAVARTQHTRGLRTRASEVSVLTGWFLPLALILAGVLLAWLRGEAVNLTIPVPDALLSVGVVALVAPVVVLLVGLAGFGLLTEATLLVVVLTYPLAFYLDLSGVLLGLTDFVAGRSQWQAVARRAQSPPRPVAPRGPSPASGVHLGPVAVQALALALATDTGAPACVTLADGPRPVSGGRHPTGVALTPVVSIPESWRLRAVLALLRRTVSMVLPRRRAPVRLFVWLGLLALFAAGLVTSRVTRIAVVAADCTPLPHDRDPWVVPPERIAGYCQTPAPPEGTQWSRRRGDFTPGASLGPPQAGAWQRLDTTFDCNLARFTPANVTPLDGGGAGLVVRAEQSGDRAFTAASIASPDGRDARYVLGRFEAVLKPARGSGLISAFFLHRRDPWQEIDLEFLGRDTTKVLLNVYFNPGEEGAPYNYGYTGTPVLVDLGFDAADAFHTYAIEWDTDELRWFVDGRLIHRRRAGRPTPIPNLPMRLYASVWPICSEELAGPVTAPLPATMEVRSVEVSRWAPDPLYKVWRFFDDVLGSDPGGPAPSQWQDSAEWLQRGRPPGGGVPR